MKSSWFRFLHRALSLIFWVHVIFLVLLTIFNYFALPSSITNESVVYSVRGDLKMKPANWNDLRQSNYEYAVTDSNGLTPALMMQKVAHGRIDFTHPDRAFEPMNLLILVFDLGRWWIWLVLTYQLMKLLSSARQGEIFNKANIPRLRWMGLVFFLAPLLTEFRNIFFSTALSKLVAVEGYRFWDPATITWKLFLNGPYNPVYLGLFTMLLLLTLAEIFRYGLSLQEEKNLTI